MIDNLRFTKMTGAGNEFLIFDAREKGFPKFDRSLFAKSLCRRSLSIGADGVVFIEKTKTPHVNFKWDFYNADGSRAEMCGNAARCVARYAVENDIADRSAAFETLAGIIKTQVKANGFVEVEMTPPKLLEKDVQIDADGGEKFHVVYLDTGVPHVVLETTEWSSDYLHDVGAFLRNHDHFKKTRGANATFYEVKAPLKIQSATFERGVEGVTLACGTGAVAAATAAVLSGLKGPIEVQVPGGLLNVDVDKSLTYARLAGEARFICDGEVCPEALL